MLIALPVAGRVWVKRDANGEVDAKTKIRGTCSKLAAKSSRRRLGRNGDVATVPPPKSECQAR